MSKIHTLIAAVALVGTVNFAHADNTNILLGGAIGGIAGAAIGQSVGGRTGAIVGAGLGGAAGASIGAGASQRYEEPPSRGHAYGHQNQWREHEHHRRHNFERGEQYARNDGGHERHGHYDNRRDERHDSRRD